jgi:hypothetical protein
MHYRNGREAKNGDHVIAPVWRGANRPEPTAGVVHQLSPAAMPCWCTPLLGALPRFA